MGMQRMIYDETFVSIFDDMANIAEEYNLKTINGVILLKGLLNENKGLLYDFLERYSQGVVPFKELNQEIDEYLKNKKETISEGSFIQIADESESLRKYYVDAEVAQICKYSIECAQTMTINTDSEESDDSENYITLPFISSEDLFLEFMHFLPKDVEKILKNHSLPVSEDLVDEFMNPYNPNEELKSLFGMNSNSTKSDEKINDYLTNLSEKYEKTKECEYLGRDEEVKRIFRILQKRSRKNAILVGDAGVGKTAIAEMIAYAIAMKKCPKMLKDKKVYLLDITSIVAGTKYRGMTEERFKLILDFLAKNKDVIVFIDEIHMMFGAGGTGEDETNDMSNTFKPYFASSDSMVIGATTEEEYQKYFLKNSALCRRFEKVVVKEPKPEAVYPMLKASIKKHSEYHGVKISKKIVEYAVLIGSCFRNSTNNPDRTNNLIDEAMVIAAEKGKKNVGKDDILEVFQIYHEKYLKMNVEQKKSTAYHEAGHYLAWKLSKTLIDQKVTAISIMPAEGYLGITVFQDISDEVSCEKTFEYHMDQMVCYIAGRVAEKVITKTYSSGAYSDLKSCNTLAYEMVTKYGLTGNNRFYLDNDEYHMIGEKICNDIDQEVQKLIEQATEKAERLIALNLEFLKEVANTLIAKGILDENDLDKISIKYCK